MRKRDSHFFSFCQTGGMATAPFPIAKRKRRPIRRRWVDGDVVRARSYSETLLLARCGAGFSENSATSTEMLWVIGFQLHFLTSATSAIGM